MKCDRTTTILTFVLGMLILLDVLFALRAINYNRELRSLQIQAIQDQAALGQLQQFESVVRDTMAYNQKNPNPELTRILQILQGTKPATK
jgi:hypothetical protein